MSYDLLNRIYRNLDIYNFQSSNNTLLYLQSIRNLYDLRRYKRSLNIRIMPSDQELRDKINQLYYQILSNNPTQQEVNELMDTAIHLRVSLPVVNIQEQADHLREYNRHVHTTPTVPTTQTTQTLPTQTNLTNLTNQTNRIPQQQTSYIPTLNLSEISSDKQNVHHSAINDSTKKSIIKLVDLYREKISYVSDDTVDSIVNLLKQRKSWKRENTKSIDFIKKNISTFGIEITLKQLFVAVYYHIETLLEYKEDLLDILNNELTDMNGKCSTGHLSRLINVLQGFDGNFSITINPHEHIKKYIYNYLSKQIKKAPDNIIENSVEEDNSLYKNYVTEIVSPVKEEWIRSFGNEHTDFIQKCIEEF